MIGKLIISLALASVFMVGLVLTTIRDSEAIPAWARKYGVDCSMCHYAAVPRLNSFGQKFRWAGYRMPDEFGKEQDVTRVGDFFATRVRARFEYENPEEKIERTEFTLHDATIFYAGPFTKNFSGFVEAEFEPEDGSTEISLIGQLQGVFGTADRFFSIRMGQMHVLQRVGVGGLDRPTGISTTPVHSATLTVNSLDPLGDTAGLKISEDQKGLELAYVHGSNRFLVLVLNGLDEGAKGKNKNFDIDPDKDYLIAYERILDDLASGFTAFYYQGTRHSTFNTGLPQTLEGRFDFSRLGANASKIFPIGPVNFEVQGGYIRSYDNVPSEAGGKDVEGHAFYVESQQFLTGPEITFLERYSLIEQNAALNNSRRHDLTAGVVLPVQTWLRVAAEYTYTDDRATGLSNHLAQLELMANW